MRDPARAVLEATLAEALGQASVPTQIGGYAEPQQPYKSAPPPSPSAAPSAPPAPASPSTAPPRRAAVVQVALSHGKAPAGRHTLPFVQNPDSPAAAAYRVLRHKLREVDSPRIIAVTSPNRKEGKTSCVIDLAMALAEHGTSKVLIVEANFRAPNVAAALGFPVPACFGAQMAAHVKTPSSPWQVVAAFFPNLHVLAVDPASVGHWVLNAPAFKIAMDQFRASDYQHIIIDCPHALGSADVNVIEDSADGVLLTAVSGSTPAASLQKAARHLAPANILGVVLLER